MLSSRRAGTLAACASLALLAGCSSSTDEASSGSPLSTAPPGTYGTPLDPSAPDPTEVATDPAPSTVPAPTGGARADATVQITYYGWNPDSSVVEVGGFVPFLVEEGGTCTLTLTQGGASATASREATPNVTSTACGELVVPGDQLAPGTWDAVLAYESERSAGSTEPVEVQVP
ncbi:hypothetical protein JKP75_15610 [Blastococcus sp. TML/M2B]|uniref:hypothetical protein n=1 Tax=unclassified Blastococcus TaxID=2619396 RepID=UPI00190A1CEA|nr:MULTISPECIES: hypothetical protein [unclassified Blastococcus]MBN1093852.1 hypothetical protein [Blastococcus sp. TML/M2B]MBN1096025.1 hypothetical protein [Blastococcus sp. TML/C7B]